MTGPPHSYQEHFSRQTRRNMRRLAETLDLDPDRYPGSQDLWAAITGAMSSKIGSPREDIPGDPFAVFVTRICPSCGPEHGPQTMVVPCPGGRAVDQTERDKMIAYVLKDQPNCADCGAPMDGNYSAEMTRHSVFNTKARKVAIS